MKVIIQLTSLSLVFAFGQAIKSGPGWDLSDEHAGDMFRDFHPPSKCYRNGVIADGNSTGEIRTVENETIYIARPPGKKEPSTAIVYLTDIFGLQLVNNRLLADSFARTGHLVILPDLFHGDPVPADALSDPDSTFNMTAWSAIHTPATIDTVINKTLTTILHSLYPSISHVAAVGYCLGGRYVARFLATDKLDAGFAAHPSNTQAAEWRAVKSPMSIAFGALDSANTAENRTNIEEIFMQGSKTYQTVLYSNAEHGFAVRTDLSVREKAFAQESAFWQAVRWIDSWAEDA